MNICIQSTFSSIIRRNMNTLFGSNRIFSTALIFITVYAVVWVYFVLLYRAVWDLSTKSRRTAAQHKWHIWFRLWQFDIFLRFCISPLLCTLIVWIFCQMFLCCLSVYCAFQRWCTNVVLWLSAADSVTNHESSVDVIRLDVSRTFPHLGIFQKVNWFKSYGECVF